MVYAHQHKLIQGTKQTHLVNKQQSTQQTLTEKCQLCDAMHHNSMLVGGHLYFNSIAISDFIYISPVYNFTSLALILSGGRAPPANIFSV
jgi:hypothetical protein